MIGSWMAALLCDANDDLTAGAADETIGRQHVSEVNSSTFQA